MNRIALLAVYLLAVLFRLWPGWRGYLGDESFTYYFASANPLFGYMDVHPAGYYLFMRGILFLGDWQPAVLVVAHALFAALAAPLAYLISPWAGFAVALWPGLVEAGNHARHPAFAATLVAAWALAWTRRRNLLPFLAHLMVLGHFSTQVVLGLSFPLMRREERVAVFSSLSYNPLVYLEVIRLITMAQSVLKDEGAPLVPNWAGALDALLAPGVWALPLAVAVALGVLRQPILGFWMLGVGVAYFLGSRVNPLYMPPMAVLAAMAAGLTAEGVAWTRWGRALALAGFVALVFLACQTSEKRREARAGALEEVRTLHQKPLTPAPGLPILVMNAHILGLPITIDACRKP
uniref:Uncharacterized protein n=1 Tax=Thermus caliditerrae TaxID=1330700 RepID=A0A7C5VET1_9DEIN